MSKLSPKICRFEPRTTGTAPVSSEDVSTALGMAASRPAGLLLRAKWAMDYQAAVAFVELQVERTEKRIARRRWKPKNKLAVRPMVWLAMRELGIVRPSRVYGSTGYELGAEKCGGCDGVGRRYSRRQEKNIQCERCEGSGEKRWTDNERASRCGLHHTSWAGNWADLYDWMLEDMRAMQRKAVAQMWVLLADVHSEHLDEKRDGHGG